jgi:predicted RNA binding protein YcfA (HicA-like mRNA interferase family)
LNPRKLFARLLAGHLRNVAFGDFRRLVEAFGFRQMRTSGRHVVFAHPGVPEHLSLQPREGEVKPYQIRQFLALVEQYNLRLGGGS